MTATEAALRAALTDLARAYRDLAVDGLVREHLPLIHAEQALARTVAVLVDGRRPTPVSSLPCPHVGASHHHAEHMWIDRASDTVYWCPAPWPAPQGPPHRINPVLFAVDPWPVRTGLL